MSKTPAEEYADSLSVPKLAIQVGNYLDSARVHFENYRSFREAPDGNADGLQERRCKFWAEMTLQSLQDADFFASAIRARKDQ